MNPSGAAARRGLWWALGPAFVAAIAYVDLGNVAANLTAGATHGHLLLWVLVAANLMAVLVQYLSAKLGLVTGDTLPALIGSRLRRPGRLAFWGQAELSRPPPTWPRWSAARLRCASCSDCRWWSAD